MFENIEVIVKSGFDILSCLSNINQMAYFALHGIDQIVAAAVYIVFFCCS